MTATIHIPTLSEVGKSKHYFASPSYMQSQMLSLLDLIGTEVFLVRWQHYFIELKPDITDCLDCAPQGC